MPMIDNEDRLRLREKARDFIISAGSPVTNSQITGAIGTNNHMTDRIINEFKDNKLIEEFPLAKGTPYEIMAWNPTQKLEKIPKKEFKEELFKIIKIEKPREDKK